MGLNTAPDELNERECPTSNVSTMDRDSSGMDPMDFRSQVQLRSACAGLANVSRAIIQHECLVVTSTSPMVVSNTTR
jgi:hypothetical protein